MQGWCVPDRCVPDQKVLDVAPLEQSVPWILCPWPRCPNPGPRQAWTAQRMDYWETIVDFKWQKQGLLSSLRSLKGWGLNRFVWKFQREQLKSTTSFLIGQYLQMNLFHRKLHYTPLYANKNPIEIVPQRSLNNSINIVIEIVTLVSLTISFYGFVVECHVSKFKYISLRPPHLYT